MNSRHFPFLLCALIASTELFATEVETAFSVYEDADYGQETTSARIQHRNDFNPSWAHMVRLVGSRSRIRDDAALRQKDTSVVLDTGSLSYSLFQKEYTYGISASKSKSENQDSTTTGLSFGRWFLEDTLEITLAYSKTDTDRDTIVPYDANGDAIFLPAYVQGKSYSVLFTNTTTPTTILTGTYTLTKRPDRPDAHMAMVEWREALPTLSSSVFSQLSYFKNRGTIERKTDYGKIQAAAVKLTWNWTLPTQEKKFVLGASTRYYKEAEEKESYFRKFDLESTLHTVNLRYRPGDGPWTDTRNEFYLFGGRYATSEPRSGNILGLGAQFNF